MNEPDFIKLNKLNLIIKKRYTAQTKCYLCKSSLVMNPDMANMYCNVVITGKCGDSFHSYCFLKWVSNTHTLSKPVCPVDRTLWTTQKTHGFPDAIHKMPVFRSVINATSVYNSVHSYPEATHADPIDPETVFIEADIGGNEYVTFMSYNTDTNTTVLLDNKNASETKMTMADVD